MGSEKPTGDSSVTFTYQALVMPAEEGGFGAVALEMGQWGFGDTPEEALEELAGVVEAHVAHAIGRGEPELLDDPAPERYQAMARELRVDYLRGVSPPPDRFARALPLPVPDVHHAA